MSSTTGNSDPYLYPGTTVLRNLRGLENQDQLDRFEARRTHLRIAQLIDTPLAGRFDLAHLKAIQRHIFQDVFDWAGEFRSVNLARGGHLFALPAFLEPALTKTLGELQLRNLLLALDSHQFAQNAAYFLGELNAAHPFREGNGRTQREFIRQLGLNAGHNVDWRSATRESMIDASQRSHVHGDSAPFASLILRCLRLTG